MNENKLSGWIARDKDGSLWLYQDEPVKMEEQWAYSGDDFQEIDREWFPTVSWKDEKPTKVEMTMQLANPK